MTSKSDSDEAKKNVKKRYGCCFLQLLMATFLILFRISVFDYEDDAIRDWSGAYNEKCCREGFYRNPLPEMRRKWNQASLR